MALFGFLQKKDVLAKPTPPPSMNDLADLPPLDAGLPPLPMDDSMQLPLGMDSMSMPQHPDVQGMAGSGNLGDIDNMDYSQPMPDTDHDEELDKATTPAGPLMPNNMMSDNFQGMQSPSQNYQNNQNNQNFQSNDIQNDSTSLNQNYSSNTQDQNNDISEDINRLFINDDSWKPADLAHYEPYMEEKIDPPDTKDFGELPTFDVQQDQAKQLFVQQTPEVADKEENYQEGYEDNVLPAQDVTTDQILERTKPTPIQLYIKGSDYRSVFSELSRMNDLLEAQEPKISMMEDITQHEDANLSSSKSNMEYMYKKLNYIDRKIFP